MKSEYLQFLREEVKLEIIGESTTSSNHHNLKCLQCGNEFRATPKSKVSKYKKFGMAGCPQCTLKDKYADTTKTNLQKLHDLGYELLEPFINVGTPILIKKTNCCGRAWRARPNNILSGNSICKPCNDEKKSQRMTKINKNKISG